MERFEVQIERELPLGADAIVRGVVQRTHPQVVVHAAHVRRVEDALAPDIAATGDRIDTVDQVVVEHVRPGEAQFHTPAEQPEAAAHTEIRGELHGGIARVRQSDRSSVRGVVGRVRAPRLRLHEDIDPSPLEPAEPRGRLPVEAQVEIRRQLVRAVPAHEGLREPRLGVAADLLQRATFSSLGSLLLPLVCWYVYESLPDQ